MSRYFTRVGTGQNSDGAKYVEFVTLRFSIEVIEIFDSLFETVEALNMNQHARVIFFQSWSLTF